MIVAMQEKATEEQIDAVIDVMVEAGVDVHRTTGATQTILAGVGPDRQSRPEQVRTAAGRALTFTASARLTSWPAGPFVPKARVIEFRQRSEDRRRAGCGHGRAVRH